MKNDSASDAQHRSPTTATGSRPAGIGVAVVAATSAVISYSHVRHLAEHSGETPLAALLLPLALDGAIAAAVAVVLADSRHGRHTRILTWVLLALGLTGSLAANIANAEPTLTARMIAAWPPLLLAVGVEVLASLGRNNPAQQVPPVPQEVPPVPEQTEQHRTQPEPRPEQVRNNTHQPEHRQHNTTDQQANAALVPLPVPGQPQQHRNQTEPGAEHAEHDRNQTEPGSGSGSGQGRNTGALPDPRRTGTTKQRATTQLAMSTLTGQPITGPDLAAALHISSSYARRLIREHADHCATPINGRPQASPTTTETKIKAASQGDHSGNGINSSAPSTATNAAGALTARH